MSLNSLLGKSLDRLFIDGPPVVRFVKQRASGDNLRRYHHATEFAQREIVFYRDKRWTANGGTLYAELFCLVPEVQHAVHGMAQSLGHFQYVLSEPNPKRSWELHSPEDVAVFAEEIREWLSSIALPWLDQFESRDGVIRFLRAKRQFVTLAEYLASMDDEIGASQAISTWLEGLPRRIENSLKRLASKGLISPYDEAYLARASIQSEEDYQQQVSKWLGNRAIEKC